MINIQLIKAITELAHLYMKYLDVERRERTASQRNSATNENENDRKRIKLEYERIILDKMRENNRFQEAMLKAQIERDKIMLDRDRFVFDCEKAQWERDRATTQEEKCRAEEKIRTAENSRDAATSDLNKIDALLNTGDKLKDAISKDDRESVNAIATSIVLYDDKTEAVLAAEINHESIRFEPI